MEKSKLADVVEKMGGKMRAYDSTMEVTFKDTGRPIKFKGVSEEVAAEKLNDFLKTNYCTEYCNAIDQLKRLAQKWAQ